jgi:hypothetical protein
MNEARPGYHQQSSVSGLKGRAVPLNSPLLTIEKQGVGGTRLSRVCVRAGDDQSTRPSPTTSPLRLHDPSCAGRCARRDSRKSRPGERRPPRRRGAAASPARATPHLIHPHILLEERGGGNWRDRTSGEGEIGVSVEVRWETGREGDGGELLDTARCGARRPRSLKRRRDGLYPTPRSSKKKMHPHVLINF